MRGAPPGSAPMHYLRTHAGQGRADRQDRRQTGGRGTPRLILLRQCARRGRNLFGKGGRLTRSATDPHLAAEVDPPDIWQPPPQTTRVARDLPGAIVQGGRCQAIRLST